ncbi:MAG: hypothetical protein WBC33_06635 [Conexibacter sp.]
MTIVLLLAVAAALLALGAATNKIPCWPATFVLAIAVVLLVYGQ